MGLTESFLEKKIIPEVVISECAGIVKTYEAVTGYCGFSFIEAGKTMGLFPMVHIIPTEFP